jgi:predicted dehydrogenase
VPELRAAIVGYGLAGSQFHAPLIASTEGLEVAAIVTANPERADRARAEHPGARVVSDVEEVFGQAGEYDFAVIATPNDAHAPLAMRALDAGLAVVVDKPLAPTAAEARDVVMYAKELGLLLTVFLNRRWDSDLLTLSRLIDDDTLGRVLRFESRFERWRPELADGAWREETPPERGGGLLLDLGTHLVDQATFLFGPVTHVYAEVEHRRAGLADDDVFVALRHESGTLSHLWASVLAAAPGPRMRVLGDRAAFLVAELDGQEAALRSGARPGDGEWGREPPERWGRLLRGEEGEEGEPVESERGAWPSFYEAFERALREGGSPPVDPQDGVAVLELLEAARRSAAGGEVVDVR